MLRNHSGIPGLVLILAAALSTIGCGSQGTGSLPAASINAGESGGDESKPSEAANTGAFAPSEYSESSWPDEAKKPPKPKPNLRPVVVITTSLGEITVRLDAEKSPLTVENFLDYVNAGYYEETVFHYVDKGFLVAAGGYTSDLTPKEARAQILNEANNGLKNRKGTIAMARHPEYSKSATSQFFFNLADNSALDHKSEESDEEYGYCVFGEVTAGLDVIDRIAELEVRDSGEFPKVPATAVVIESMRLVK